MSIVRVCICIALWLGYMLTPWDKLFPHTLRRYHGEGASGEGDGGEGLAVDEVLAAKGYDIGRYDCPVVGLGEGKDVEALDAKHAQPKTWDIAEEDGAVAASAATIPMPVSVSRI